MNIEQILNNNWKKIEVNFEDFYSITQRVPRKPGIYSISTNAPLEILKEYGERKDPKHYNLKKKIKASKLLPEKLKIQQEGNQEYIVYNGHHGTLRQRLCEHFKGSNGTGCLALFRIENLKNYRWFFNYIDLSQIDEYEDNKLLGTFLEQKHRSNIDWPILCSQ